MASAVIPSLSSASTAASSSPPSSPRRPLGVSGVANIFLRMRRSRESAKLHHIISSSGDEPQTHPSLAGSTIAARKVPVAQDAEYICADAVNVPTLLRSTRAMLLERAQRIGASCLVGEEWTCTICGPKHRSDGTFRVHIRYSADATRSDRPDPRKPVAVAEAKSVPGLMTIIERR